MTFDRTQSLLLALVALLAAGVTAFFVHPRYAGGGTAPASVGAADELVAQLQRIEQRLDRLERQDLVSQHAQPLPAAVQARLDSRERDRARRIDEARRQRASFDATFANAPRGGARQAAATKALGDQTSNPALAVEASPPLSRDIQCRGDLCRMEFVFDHVSKADDWAMLYPALTGRQLSRIDHYNDRNPDGTTSLVMYGRMK